MYTSFKKITEPFPNSFVSIFRTYSLLGTLQLAVLNLENCVKKKYYYVWSEKMLSTSCLFSKWEREGCSIFSIRYLFIKFFWRQVIKVYLLINDKVKKRMMEKESETKVWSQKRKLLFLMTYLKTCSC